MRCRVRSDFERGREGMAAERVTESNRYEIRSGASNLALSRSLLIVDYNFESRLESVHGRPGCGSRAAARRADSPRSRARIALYRSGDLRGRAGTHLVPHVGL